MLEIGVDEFDLVGSGCVLDGTALVGASGRGIWGALSR